MSTFHDNAGRQWTLAIDIPDARRIRKELQVDILNLDLEDEHCGLRKISKDPILFVDVLYLLCRPQCEGREISDEEFGRALGGDALGEALDAYVEALSDFCPPRQRKFLIATNRTANSLLETLTGIAESRLAEASISGRSSPGSPESSAMSPPGACEN